METAAPGAVQIEGVPVGAADLSYRDLVIVSTPWTISTAGQAARSGFLASDKKALNDACTNLKVCVG